MRKRRGKGGGWMEVMLLFGKGQRSGRVMADRSTTARGTATAISFSSSVAVIQSVR